MRKGEGGRGLLAFALPLSLSPFRFGTSFFSLEMKAAENIDKTPKETVKKKYSTV
jgi:hypothetical protein